MASNRELAAQAAELGEKLGREVKTHGLNHDALEELVAELSEELDATTPAAESVGGEGDPEQSNEPAASAPPEQPGKALAEPIYTIAPKRGLTSLRGILGPGEVVSARDFHGGQSTLDHLVDVGAVLKS